MIKNLHIWNLFQKIDGDETPIDKLGKVRNIPGSKLLQLLKFIKKTNEEYDSIDKARIELIKKHGKEQEDGSIKVPDDLVNDFQKDFFDLLNSELEWELMLDVSILDQGFSVTDAAILEPFIKE